MERYKKFSHRNRFDFSRKLDHATEGMKVCRFSPVTMTSGWCVNVYACVCVFCVCKCSFSAFRLSVPVSSAVSAGSNAKSRQKLIRVTLLSFCFNFFFSFLLFFASALPLLSSSCSCRAFSGFSTARFICSVWFASSPSYFVPSKKHLLLSPSLSLIDILSLLFLPSCEASGWKQASQPPPPVQSNSIRWYNSSLK